MSCSTGLQLTLCSGEGLPFQKVEHCRLVSATGAVVLILEANQLSL